MELREKLLSGLVIPAHPLALNSSANWTNAASAL